MFFLLFKRSYFFKKAISDCVVKGLTGLTSFCVSSFPDYSPSITAEAFVSSLTVFLTLIISHDWAAGLLASIINSIRKEVKPQNQHFLGNDVFPSIFLSLPYVLSLSFSHSLSLSLPLCLSLSHRRIIKWKCPCQQMKGDELIVFQFHEQTSTKIPLDEIMKRMQHRSSLSCL